MAAVTMHHFSGLAAPFVRSKGTISGGVFILVEYDVSDDKYTLTTIDNKALTTNSNYTGLVNTGTGYDEGRASVTINSNEYDIDSGAMIVINSDPTGDDDYICMTGDELMALDDFDFTGTVYAVLDGNTVIALFAQTNESVMSSTKTYGYIVNAWIQQSSDGSDNNTLWVDIIVDGEGLIEDQETSRTVNSSTVANWANKIVTYSMSDGIMTVDQVAGTTSAVASRTNNSVYITSDNGSTTDRYMITSDTVVIVIDGEGDDAEYAGNNISAIEPNQVTGTYKNNIFFKANGSQEFEVIVVQLDANEEF